MAATPGRRAKTSWQHPAGGPGRPVLVPREGLLAALDRAAVGKVTVIAASAGSGKTSLLRAWADRQGRRCRLATVQVQRDQHDAQLFWLALLKAVRELPGAPASADPPAAAPDYSGAALVDRILAELAMRVGHGDLGVHGDHGDHSSRSDHDGRDDQDDHRGHSDPGTDVVLILDDVHELTSPDTLAQLTRLLTGLPSGAHAVLATRRDLPLRLHQLRLDGELAELRAADLRFTEQEARELLAASGITLSDTAVSLLYQRTEGWAAGLRLAAISLEGHPDPERFVAEFSGSSRTVAQYLVAEMLERQPDEVQKLLLRTSILEGVNGELADLLAGRPGAERVLLDLEDANAFVVSLDPERTWFRYHHLFADLLRLELRRRLPGEVTGLHRRAADWFTRQGRTVEAVRHRQAAGDWSAAAALLADHSFGMMLDGQEETMQALLEAFPQRVGAEDHPELCVVRAMVDLVHGRLDAAAAHLTVTEACLESVSADRRDRLRAAIAWLELSLARRRGRLEDVMRHAEFLGSPVGGGTDGGIAPAGMTAPGGELRVMALMNLGTVEAWSLGLPDGERHLREGVELARRIGRPYLEVACLAQLGFASKLLSFARSRRHCEEAIALAEQHGWGTAPILAPALVTLACTMVWTGGFDEAERVLQRADTALRSDDGPGIRTLLHLVKGMLHAGRGRSREAYEDFAAARELQSRFPDPHALAGFVTGWTLATRARLGEAAEARAELQALDGPLADSAELRTARAAICLAEGDPAGALTALEPVLDGGAPAVHVATVVEAQLLCALAHRELGERGGPDEHGERGEPDEHGEPGELGAASAALEQALTLAEPERLILPFVMTGADVLLKTVPFETGLHQTVPRREPTHAALLADILDVVHGTSAAAAVRPSPAAGELSPTELRVLRYLPTNLSRTEIAGELSVSVNTVNTHVRNIYAKLQAAGRSMAVRRARELRLLAGGPGR